MGFSKDNQNKELPNLTIWYLNVIAKCKIFPYYVDVAKLIGNKQNLHFMHIT